MGKRIYYILQWTWALPLNLVGLAVRLFVLGKTKADPPGPPGRSGRYRHAAVTFWPYESSMAIGMFIFLGRNGIYRTRGASFVSERILAHEYGHTIQSVLLGPIYFVVVAIPSLLWANSGACRAYRKRTGRSYYAFYPERWADRLGGAGEASERDRGRLMKGTEAISFDRHKGTDN